MEATNLISLPAPVKFLGIQDGFRDRPPIEIYTLLVPVGEHPTGSSVSRQTLEKFGFTLLPAA